MKKALGFSVLAMLIASTPLLADTTTGADKLLCSSSVAIRCDAVGDCISGLPWTFNMPQFIEIDLDKKVLSTTKASGQNRSTPIANSSREDGQIILQGVQNARAFSIVITEETGRASFAVAANEISVAAFGACTPMPGN